MVDVNPRHDTLIKGVNYIRTLLMQPRYPKRAIAAFAAKGRFAVRGVEFLFGPDPTPRDVRLVNKTVVTVSYIESGVASKIFPDASGQELIFIERPTFRTPSCEWLWHDPTGRRTITFLFEPI